MHRPRPSLQEEYAPSSICFGCGPANTKGLHIRSFAEGERVVAEWTPESHHQAFPGMLGGGIIGTLLDCHSNWTAAWHLMQRNHLDRPPTTVTADYHVKLKAPTPMGPVKLVARVVESKDARAVVEAELIAQDK